MSPELLFSAAPLLTQSSTHSSLDVIRLSFPSLPWYSIVLNVTRLNASDLPAHLLLYTMLWLVLPRLDGVKTGVYHMVTTIIEELGNKFLSGRGKADDVFAPQAFDLLFAFWPLALGNERPAGKRASRPFVFGSQLLRANLRFSPRDRNISSYHRLYCCLLAAPQWIPEGFETSSCFDPPNTLLGWIGFVAVRQRMELLSLIKRYEDKLERLEDQFGEPLPSDRLAGQLVTLFEAFVGEVAGEREYLATILSESQSAAFWDVLG